ncbi:MAG: alpha/beta hydrolase [Clostridia bacterium]|nr:alpha/beta hydrolase [Clostridia bacterium]
MVKLIREENYEQMMRGVVEPGLEAMREEIEMPLDGGGTLHCEIYNRYDAKRAVVIVHGYTESAEKFRELVWYFIHSGFSVFSYDQRGHGRSVRGVADTSITHVDRFDDYLRDLEQFVESVVRPRMGDAPLYLYGHSMGGAVAAFALIRHPDWFARAVLNAPMIAPVTKPLPRKAAKALGALYAALGKGRERAFVGKPFDPAREKFDTSCMTSRARFDYYQHKRNTRRELQNCSPTYAWVREAAGVTEPLLQNAPQIQTPILLCQAELDNIVELEEQNRFVELAPNAQKATFRAKHELYSSEQSVMEEYVKTVIGFLSQD